MLYLGMSCMAYLGVWTRKMANPSFSMVWTVHIFSCLTVNQPLMQSKVLHMKYILFQGQDMPDSGYQSASYML